MVHIVMKHLAKNAAGTFIYRRRVPLDLLEAIGARELKRSLETRELDTALKRFPAAAAWADGLIESARARPGQAGQDFDRLAARWLSEKIAHYPADLEPLPADERSVYADDPPLPWRQRQAAEAAKALGLALRPGSKQASAWQAAIDSALADLSDVEEAMKNGDPLPLPIAERAADAVAATITDAHKAWLSKRKAAITKKATIEAAHALSLFTAKFGDIRLDKITRRNIADFRNDLVETRAVATAKKLLQFVKNFIDAAINDALVDIENPAAGASFAGIIGKRTAKRRAFENAELTRLFALSTFTDASFKDDMQAAKFWLPLMSLYCGARESELISLDAADVQQIDEVWCIKIREDIDRGRTLKTESASRTVPLHAALLTMNFAQFVEKKKGRIFDIPPDVHGTAGGIFSKHINRLIDKASKDPALTFHSFRHNFVQAAVAADIPRDLRRLIAGHSDDHVAETNYSESAGIPLTRIKAAIDAISYTSIDVHALAASAKRAIEKM